MAQIIQFRRRQNLEPVVEYGKRADPDQSGEFWADFVDRLMKSGRVSFEQAHEFRKVMTHKNVE